jgi:hypothetical protein
MKTVRLKITSESRTCEELRHEFIEWLEACSAQARRRAPAQSTNRGVRYQEAKADAFQEAADFWRDVSFRGPPDETG